MARLWKNEVRLERSARVLVTKALLAGPLMNLAAKCKVAEIMTLCYPTIQVCVCFLVLYLDSRPYFVYGLCGNLVDS